jgi:hypothetical protein
MTGVLLRRVKPARPGSQHDDDYDVIDDDGLAIERFVDSRRTQQTSAAQEGKEPCRFNDQNTYQ